MFPGPGESLDEPIWNEDDESTSSEDTDEIFLKEEDPTDPSLSPHSTSSSEPIDEHTEESIPTPAHSDPPLIQYMGEISIEHVGTTFKEVFNNPFHQEAILRDCLKKSPHGTIGIVVITTPINKGNSYRVSALYFNKQMQSILGEAIFIDDYSLGK